MLGLAGGAGFALSVVLLPAADIGPEAWRGRVRASARSARSSSRCSPGTCARPAATSSSRRGPQRAGPGPRGRRPVATAGGSCSSPRSASSRNIFSAPSAQFTNRFLSRRARLLVVGHRRRSGASPPGSPACSGSCSPVASPRPAAGARSRSSACSSAPSAPIVFFLGDGAVLWIFMTVAIVAAAPAALAVGTMDAELFPTEVRGTSNALLLVTYVLGSVVGLVRRRASSPTRSAGSATRSRSAASRRSSRRSSSSPGSRSRAARSSTTSARPKSEYAPARHG